MATDDPEPDDPVFRDVEDAAADTSAAAPLAEDAARDTEADPHHHDGADESTETA